MHRLNALFATLLPIALLASFSTGNAQPPTSQAVSVPGTTAVGTSAAPVSVSVTLPNGGTIASVNVFGQGIANVDFSATGGTCAPGASFLATQSCTATIVFAPTSPGPRSGAIVLLDSSNNVLGTQLLSGWATGSVGVFVPGIINTVAGDASWVFAGDGNPAISSPIFLPFGIAVDAKGNLFIADSSNNRIRRVDAVSGIMTTVAGNGIVGSTGDGGPATSASLNTPTSVALDPAGNIFIADSGNQVIRRVDAFTGNISTFAGTLTQHGYTGDGAAATSAKLKTPNGISFDINGNLYIADTGNHAIRFVNAANGIITTIAGTGTAGFSGDGGTATSAQLNAPWSATPIPSAIGGGVSGFYIADQNNNRIRKVDSSGNISTFAGSSAGYTGDAGPASQAELYEPASVLIDVAGDLYIADSGNNVVRRVSATTGIITTYAGNGTESFSGDAGPADKAGLYGPYAFALDNRGNLYIADVFHNRIRQVVADTAILNYPVIRVGRISAPLTQTLENDGNAPLDITKFNAVLNSQIDAATTTCSQSTPLAILAQCIIGVDFAPTTIGPTVTGELDVDSNAGNSPGIINLSGQVLAVNPTTLTLTSNINPSATGAPVIFTATVSNTTTPAPTGPVNFLDGATVIGTGTLDATGATTFTTSALAHGSHNMTATYAGDSQNAAAKSATLVQVVKDQQAPTSTTLTAAAPSGIAGASINFTATVNIVVANSGIGNITGTVTFKQGATVLGTSSINAATATGASGVATIALSNLPVGTDNITATYAGNTDYAGSTSAPLTETINLATAQIGLTSATNPSFAGAAVPLTATLTSNGGTPTGSVSFLDGATLLGSSPINSQGLAILSAPGHFFTVGTHILTATYNGDANDSGATSTPINQVVNTAPTSSAISSSLNPAGFGAPVTFTVVVTTEGGPPTGTVQFFDNGSGIGFGTLATTGTNTAAATLNTSALALGTHPITATYAGDALNSTSTTAPALSQIINATTDSVTLTSSANPALFAAPLTLTAKVTGTGAAPTGTVALIDGTTTIATLPVPANGIIAFLNPTLAIGPHTLTAAYSGDATHTAITSSTLTQSILQGTSTALSASSTAVNAGTSVSITATITGSASKPLSGSPIGTITFTDGTTVLAVVAPNASGVATYTTATLAPGQHPIIASYSGDSNDASSASTSLSITVTIATTQTSFATSVNPINSGATLTLTSAVTGNGGTPTGTVTFHDGGTVLTAVQLSPTGTASFPISTLAPGIHQLSASYSGDSLDGPSTSSTIAQQVVEQTSVTLTSSENPALLQDNVVLSITVSNGTQSQIPSGSVTLTDGTNTLATIQLSATGTATFTLQAPSLGTHTLVATYEGDNNNRQAASMPLTETVTLRPTTTSFTPSSANVSFGQQITLISVVNASGSRPATGSVTWIAGSTTLGSVAIDSTGLASLTITPQQGVFNAVAQYSGDALYAASVSAPVTITVGPTTEFVITLNPTSLSIVSGDRATIGITVTPAASFTDTLAMGCAGLPQFATCTFSRSQVPVSGGVAQTLSVTVDTGNPLGAGAAAELKSQPSLTQLCALPFGALFAFVLFGNRRRLNRLHPRLALFTLLLIFGLAATTLTGCGSSLNTSKTVPGSYSFQIVASGNSTLVTQTTQIALTVTK